MSAGSLPWRPTRWVAVVSGYSGRFLITAAAGAVVIALLLLVRPIVLGVLLATLLATLFVPVGDWLRARHVRPAFAAAISVVLLLAVAAAAVYLVVRSVVSQWDEISASVAAGVERLVADAGEATNLDAGQRDEVLDDIAALWDAVAEILVRGVVALVPVLAELVTTAGLAVLVLFFFVKDGAGLWASFLGVAPRRRELLDDLGRASWSTLAGYLRGMAIVATVDAVAIALGVWLIGVPFVGAIAVLTFFAAFIPTVGAILAGGVAVLIALADGGWSAAVATLAVVLVVQQLESNVLQPVIVGRATRLHPLAIFLSITTGALVAGVAGMFLAVPLTATAATVVRELRGANGADALDDPAERPGAAPSSPPSSARR